jgi:hypothetical protein
VAGAPAAAHSPLPGVEGLYAGLVHPLASPPQLLAILGAALLLGSHGLARIGPAFACLGAGLLGGLALLPPEGNSEPWLLGLAAASAGAAALAPGRLPRAALLVVAGAAGLLLGWASLPDPGPPRDRLFTMSGSVLGVALAMLYVSGGSDLLRERVAHPAVAVALRVAAAWVGAIAILALALSASPAIG